MTIRTEFPHQIVEEPDMGIVMSDGCRLSARVWMPRDAVADPVPAILEYIPYRKRDGTRGRDEPMHGWFAANGLAAMGDKAKEAMPALREVQKSEDKKSKLAKAAQEAAQRLGYDDCKVHEFVSKMDYAYAIADLVVARAGAISPSVSSRRTASRIGPVGAICGA